MRPYHFDSVPLGSDWYLPFSLDAASSILAAWGPGDIVEIGISSGKGWDDYGHHQGGSFAEWSATNLDAGSPITLRDPTYIDIKVPARVMSQWGAGTLDVKVRYRNDAKDINTVLLIGRLPVV